jgi:hypothetical protein
MNKMIVLLLSQFLATSSFAGVESYIARSLQNTDVKKIISDNEIEFDSNKPTYTSFVGIAIGGSDGEEMQGGIVYDLSFGVYSTKEPKKLKTCKVTIEEHYAYDQPKERIESVTVRNPLVCK